jgi:hypothetical protein
MIQKLAIVAIDWHSTKAHQHQMHPRAQQKCRTLNVRQRASAEGSALFTRPQPLGTVLLSEQKHFRRTNSPVTGFVQPRPCHLQPRRTSRQPMGAEQPSQGQWEDAPGLTRPGAALGPPARATREWTTRQSAEQASIRACYCLHALPVCWQRA